MKLYELNRPKGHNRYCGPAAVSFLTGLDTNTTAAMFRLFSEDRATKGTFTRDMLSVLHGCGIRTNAQPNVRGRTLAGWLKAYKDKRTEGRMWLVSAGHHWQLITGRRYACGRIGAIVSVRDERVKRRARVNEVYELSGEVNPDPLLKQVQEASQKNKGRTAAMRILNMLDRHRVIDLDILDDGEGPGSIGVYPGAILRPLDEGTGEPWEDMVDDPYEGDHYADDHNDALVRAYRYRDIAKARRVGIYSSLSREEMLA